MMSAQFSPPETAAAVSPLRSQQGRLTDFRFRVCLNTRSSMCSSASPVLSEDQIEQLDRILDGGNDEHGGVIVEMNSEPLDPSVFSSLLKASLGHWRQQLLVVQEKSGRFRGTGVWKFPTGVVDEGEDICDAAVREVKEETGVDSKFLEILAFRQSHKSFFGKSDLSFVCMLQPLSFDIQPQEAEIEAVQWMPYEEYLAQPFVQKHDLIRKLADICIAKTDRAYSGFLPVPSAEDSPQNKARLYANTKDLGIS